MAGFAAGTWTLLSIVHLVLTYANVAGRPLDSASFGAELGVFVTQIDLGRTLLLITTVAAVVTALALVVTTPTGAAWTAAIVLVALWQQAQLGHAAGASGHDIATSSMVVHLVGAAIWIGALTALALLVRRVGTDLSASVARYSVIAGWCFVAVAVSGLVNGLLRTTGWSDLTTTYGLLLLAKVALFGVLGLLGLAHRRTVLPQLATRTTDWLFWRLVLVELTVMGAVSGVAVALGETAPPVPEEPPADPSPAYQLTGHPLPPEPSGLLWVTEWRWDLVLASAAVAGLVVYWRWVLRLRRRGRLLVDGPRRVVDRRHGPVLLGHQRRTRPLRARPVQRAHGPAHGARDGRAPVPRALGARHPRAARPARSARRSCATTTPAAPASGSSPSSTATSATSSRTPSSPP